jgi:hypothetical protein
MTITSAGSAVQSGAADRDAWLSPLAGLVVPGGLAGDDVQPVPGVDAGDERHQGGKLLIVVVLGGVLPGLVGYPSSRAARSASVKTVASRQVATRLMRTDVSPPSAASLVCMSVQ